MVKDRQQLAFERDDDLAIPDVLLGLAPDVIVAVLLQIADDLVDLFRRGPDVGEDGHDEISRWRAQPSGFASAKHPRRQWMPDVGLDRA